MDISPPPWRTAAAGAVALAVVLGAFGSVGILIDPLAAEYGVPRAALVPMFGLASCGRARSLSGAHRSCGR